MSTLAERLTGRQLRALFTVRTREIDQHEVERREHELGVPERMLADRVIAAELLAPYREVLMPDPTPHEHVAGLTWRSPCGICNGPPDARWHT